MRQPVTQALFSYWNRLRGDRAAPERTEIDPAAIRASLSDTFMLEIDDERTFPIRLSGARINALFMQETKGRSFRDLWDQDDMGTVSAVIESVTDDPTPALVGVRAAPGGREPLDLEMLLLPLRHHGRTHARLLGSLTPVGRPTWYGLLPVDALTVTSLRILHACAMGGETQIAAVPLPTHLPLRQAHLRVFSGGLDHSTGRSK